MKILALLVFLVLTACGTDEKSTPIYEVALPATFSEGTILTSGAILGDENCFTNWPAVMPYEVAGARTYHANEKQFEPVEGKDNTWSFQGERVNGYLPVTTFKVAEDSVYVKLECSYKEPIEHAL